MKTSNQKRKASIGLGNRAKRCVSKFDYFDAARTALMAIPLELTLKRKLLGALRARDFSVMDKYLDAEILNAMHEGSPEYLYALRTTKALYSKYEGVRSPDGDAKALDTWYKAERFCRRANRRIRLTTLGLIGGSYAPYLEKAKRIVHKILGKFEFSEFAQSCRHGPGVAIGVAGVATSGAFKYASSVYTVSPACATLFRDLVITDKTWFDLVTKHQTRLEVVEDCDKLSFVPKNWKTDRTIGVAPLGNLYCQLGIGEMISSRLKRVGIDIHDQRNNQRAARSASLHEGPYGDSYVTIDLSMASDTVSRELVKFLVPEDWYRLLDCTRTSQTRLPDGSLVRVHKFSAMGNGFTFPLETLIFYAISQSVMSFVTHRNRVWVYGDDIIVPRGMSLLLTEVLRWVGFSVNIEKSFFHGDFYESCGTDYLRGVPVRPVHWKSRFEHDRNIYVTINALGADSSDFPHLDWISTIRTDLLSRCSSPVLFGPPITVDWGPELVEIDDRVVTTDRSIMRTHLRNGILWCKVYRTAPRRKPVDDDFAYLQARHGLKRRQVQSHYEKDRSVSSRNKDGKYCVPIRLTSTGTCRVSIS